MPRSTSDGLSPRSLARSSNDVPARDAATRRRGFLRVREHDLRHLAPFRRAELAAVLLEDFPGVLVGDLGPFADLFGRDRDKGNLAVFGRAELGLALVEIGGQRFRRRRIDGAGLRGVELDVFDGALFVLEAAQRLDQRLSAVRARPRPCRRSDAAAIPAAVRRYSAVRCNRIAGSWPGNGPDRNCRSTPLKFGSL